MRVLVLLFLALTSTGWAFVPSYSPRSSSSRLFSSSSSTDTDKVPLEISGQNIELTPALVDHIHKRIGGPLNKLAKGGAVKECEVVLSVSKNPKVKDSHRVEVITGLKGTRFVVFRQTSDMYESIDQASHALHRKLGKYKQRRLDGYHGGSHMADDLMNALQEIERMQDYQAFEQEEFYVDPEKPQIAKVNSFDLEKPMTIEEAVFALDYVDHDFFVFRNQANDKIGVVYKRNVGGIGLVEP